MFLILNMKKIIISLHPLQKVLASFIVLILFGTFLLMIPLATHHGIGFIDALFTSTSAVCVTGLIVLDTAADFTFFGRMTILFLIQFGGFGIMTFSLGLVSLLGRDLSVKWKYTLEGMYTDTGKVPIRSILKRVIKYTFIIETATALILFSQFYKDFPLLKAIEHSVFHAVSAFCNAGFSTFSDNLVGYQKNYIITVSIAVAIILGGLGFIVLNEVSRFLYKKRTTRGRIPGLSIHTKIILIMTVFLVVSGTIVFFILEWNNTLKDMNTFQAVLTSAFQSVTCRTAGFNTVDIARLRESTLFMMIGLMFIGGSPGSIAGGIKTTTMFVIFMLIYTKFKGRKTVTVWGRSLDNETVDRSITLFILAIVFVSVITFLILALHDSGGFSFLPVFFETVSAFGTVGLSTGITGRLPDLDKVILTVVMLTGRLGLLTVLMVFTLKKKKINLEYPREHIMIG